MKYKETHPRKVRGGAVHKTISEKMEEITIKRTKLHHSVPAGVMNQGDTERVVFRKDNEKDNELIAVPEAYLVPEMDHFVETPYVKMISDRMKMWLKIGYPVHLIGPTGCGKTSLALNTAKELGRPVVWINGDESITTTDLIGGYSQIEQESLRDKYIHNVFKSNDILKADWVDNPLSIACKYGYTLVYNEFSRTKPAANNVLLSVFEEGILELPTKFGEERYINVHPDFKAIFSSNSIEYAGVHRPQDALLDRMVSIYMNYYDFDSEVKIVSAQTGIAEHDARTIVRVVRDLREKLPDAEKPGTRACIMIGCGLAASNGSGHENFEQICIDVIAAKTSSPIDLLEKQNLVREVLAGIS